MCKKNTTMPGKNRMYLILQGYLVLFYHYISIYQVSIQNNQLFQILNKYLPISILT